MVSIQKKNAYSIYLKHKNLNLFEMTTINYQKFKEWWKAQQW